MRLIPLAIATLCLAARAGAQSPSIEVRGTAYLAAVTRTFSLDDSTLQTFQGAMHGGEIALRSRYAGLALRLLDGVVSTPTDQNSQITSGDVRLQLGPRGFALDGGYGRRASSGSMGTTVYGFYWLGVASIIDLGSSGFTARASAAFYKKASDDPLRGGEVMAALEYHPRRFPITLLLGYRSEITEALSSNSPFTRPESIKGIIGGVGVRFAR